jgi:hypothetical protein
LNSTSLLFSRDNVNYPSSLLLEREEWGLRSVDLVNPPRRFWSDQPIPMPIVEPGIDARRLREIPTPATLLRSLSTDDNWTAQTRRSLDRLRAFFLVCEDPQRRMDAREVESFSRGGAELLFQVFADRYERGSILITSNLPFGEWGQIF